MKKYIIALSTLLCATAIHGAASQPPKKPRDLFEKLSRRAEKRYQQQSDSDIVGTMFGLLTQQTPEPSHDDFEKGAQACNSIEKWWEEIQKITLHPDYQFTHQALIHNAKIMNESCLNRKRIFAKHAGKITDEVAKMVTIEDDNALIDNTPKLKEDFALVQSMATTTKVCGQLDFFKKNPTLIFPESNSTFETCHLAKKFCTNIEQTSKDGHRINDKTRENFIEGVYYLVKGLSIKIALTKSIAEEHATPVPSADMRT